MAEFRRKKKKVRQLYDGKQLTYKYENLKKYVIKSSRVCIPTLFSNFTLAGPTPFKYCIS